MFLFTILSVQHGSAEEQLNRPKRGFSIFKHFPSFNIFSKKEEPVKLEPIYPIWKVHKYNGVQLKPVTLGELSQSLIKKDITEPPAPTKPQIIPSLEQLKLLLGTTSDAETIDALKEVTSTRGGLRMVAGFIKANIENAKVLAKSSDEAESKTEKYRYSIPAEDEKPEEFIDASSDEKSPIEKDSSAIIVSSVDPASSDKVESSQHPFHLGLNYVKSVFGSKPKIFIPPKIFVLPKSHNKQKFIIQPISNESKSDIFNSSLGDHSNFAASGQSFLPFYGPPKADGKVLDHEKLNPDFFKESSFGSSKKIFSETIGEEYGLPSVEYGSPKFSSHGAFSQQLHNTYGVPQVENLGAVSIPNIPVPHEVYGNPKPDSNHFKMENKSQIDTSRKNQTVLKHEKEQIIPFPIIPALPSLPEPDFLTKFHHGHLPGKSVFSFTGPVAFKSVDFLKKPNIVVSKFEKPGFSYTQLSELPLEEGRRLQRTSGQVSSYGDDVSSHVFDIDSAPAASNYKPIRVRPSLKKTKMNDDSHNHSHSHSQSQAIAVPTMSPKRRWVPKSKRVYNN